MTDLESLEAEPAPRSAATWRRLAGRVRALGALVGYAILTLCVALMLGAGVLLGGIHVTGEHASATAIWLVLAAWAVTFALCWLPFALWVAHRRHAARALLRDGVLVDGSIEHVTHTGSGRGQTSSTSISFVANGKPRRASFSINGNPHGLMPGSQRRVLFTPGARYCLVFPTGDHAVMARFDDYIVIDREAGRLTVTLRRTGMEKLVAVVAALVLLQSLFLAVSLRFAPPRQLRCERAKNECTQRGSTIFRTEWSWSFPMSASLRSEAHRGRYDELEWILRTDKRAPIQLGSPTGDARQQAEYRRLAVALQRYFDDPSQPTFEASFAGTGGGSLGAWIFVALALGFLFFRLVHGARTTLVFDRAAGTLTVTRSPALVPPSRRTLPLAELARTETASGGLFLLYAYVPTLTIRLVGKDGKVRFARRQPLSRHTLIAFQRDVEAIDDFLRASASTPASS